MKKILATLLVAGTLVVSCTPKASPAKTEALIPDAAAVKTSKTMVAAGQTLFVTKCTKCHGPKDEYVTTHTYEETRPVLAAMVQKAKLNDKEIAQVSAYVHSVSKK